MQSDGELMADDVIKTTFYLDRKVHKALRNLAIQQNRSMNQQAQYLLRRALMPTDDRVSRVLAATKQAARAESLMQQVRALGHWPKETEGK